MLKTKLTIKENSYDLLYYPFKFESLEQKKVSDIVDKYLDDFKNILDWGNAVQENLGKNLVTISCNDFRLQETRVNDNKDSQYLISADFSLKFLSDKSYQAKDIKDIIQLHGIRYSRGYRYWFLFEMSQSFLQLYMFPYYKYGNL